MPDISVIIPVYNSELYLGECIKSVLSQTYTNIEILVVDDGSTDGSPQICDHYAQKDDRIRVIHKPNEGVSAARNIGIEKANGEYIVFVDSDDRLDSNALEKAYKIATNVKADLVVWNYYFVRGSELNQNEDFPEDGVYKDDGIINSLIASAMCPLICELKTPNDLILGMGFPWNKMFRNSVLKDNTIKFNVDISMYEDVAFVCRYLKHTTTIAFLNECNYFYRVLDAGATNRYKASIVDNDNKLIAELKKALPEMTELQKEAFTARKIRCISDIAKYRFFHKDNKKKDLKGFLYVIKSNKEYAYAIRETKYEYLTFKQKLMVMLLKIVLGNN